MNRKGTYAVVPLPVGTAPRRKSVFMMGAAPDPIDLPFLMFCVTTPDATLLVDTGVPEPGDDLIHGPLRQGPDQHSLRALAAIGVGAGDVDVVINTHLHWDHCANNHLFPNARFYVQREELRYAAAPLPVHRDIYRVRAGEMPPYVTVDYHVLDGDADIVPGVSVMLTPGHTPGLQSVVVRAPGGGCVIAGDNIPFYENLPERSVERFRPSTLYMDLKDYYASVRRVLELGLPVVPGHDAGVAGQANLLALR